MYILSSLLIAIAAFAAYIGLLRNSWVYWMRTKIGNHIHATNRVMVSSRDYGEYGSFSAIIDRYDNEYASYAQMIWRFWDWNSDIEHWRRRPVIGGPHEQPYD